MEWRMRDVSMRAALLGLVLAACTPAPPAEEAPAEAGAPPQVTIIQRECAPPDCNGIASVRDIEFGAARIGAQFEDYPRGWRRDRLSCDNAMLAGRDDLCVYSHEGVIYGFERGARLVTKQIYLRFPPEGMPVWPQGRALPYGLRGDETPQEAMATIEANTGVKMDLHDVFGHAELASRAMIYTADNTPVSISLRYEGYDDLVWIAIYGPRTPREPDHYRRYQNRNVAPAAPSP